MTGKTCTRLAADLYRQRTAEMTPISLRRKTCACGRVVTAKQLVQYGRCDPCVRAASTADEDAAA
jgi:hypothetical protein